MSQTVKDHIASIADAIKGLKKRESLGKSLEAIAFALEDLECENNFMKEESERQRMTVRVLAGVVSVGEEELPIVDYRAAIKVLASELGEYS